MRCLHYKTLDTCEKERRMMTCYGNYLSYVINILHIGQYTKVLMRNNIFGNK